MNLASSNPDHQLVASNAATSVGQSPHTDGAKRSLALLTKLAYSAYASWLSNGRQSYGV